MQIKLKLFATLSKYLPPHPFGSAVEIDLVEGTSLGVLAESLKLPPDEVKICFVNGRICELDTILNDGDEVGIFPPIGGG